jgi:c-di-GMP-binding flagellar brake protein YcgR
MTQSSAERRLSPRYVLHGPVSVRLPLTDGDQLQTQVLDISLNGALLGASDTSKLKPGMALEVVLDLPEMPQMIASAHVAHVGLDKFGVEFSDMETRDFAVFSALVLMLEQRTRLRQIDLQS